MTEAKQITLPLTDEALQTLRAGDMVELSGVLYTARDAAHARLCRLLDEGRPLPIDLKGVCLYYAGPCPAAPGEVLGPCGPTTSSRMDAYTPRLVDEGQTAMVGKGKRSPDITEALRGRAAYFAAPGGAGYLIAQCIRSSEVAAFPELGTEAIRRLTVERLPAVVAVDAFGGDVYRQKDSACQKSPDGLL